MSRIQDVSQDPPYLRIGTLTLLVLLSLDIRAQDALLNRKWSLSFGGELTGL